MQFHLNIFLRDQLFCLNMSNYLSNKKINIHQFYFKYIFFSSRLIPSNDAYRTGNLKLNLRFLSQVIYF